MDNKETKEKQPYQYDLELCDATPCWRFKQNEVKCSNCPWISKTKKVRNGVRNGRQ